jgi:hypothetical protein
MSIEETEVAVAIATAFDLPRNLRICKRTSTGIRKRCSSHSPSEGGLLESSRTNSLQSVNFAVADVKIAEVS